MGYFGKYVVAWKGVECVCVINVKQSQRVRAKNFLKHETKDVVKEIDNSDR